MMLYKVRATKIDIVGGGSNRGLQQRYGYCVINNAQWLCRSLCPAQQKLTLEEEPLTATDGDFVFYLPVWQQLHHNFASVSLA